MPLTKIKFAPGIDKQDTAVGAEGRWVDSDNVRFRYGLPEKVGGCLCILQRPGAGLRLPPRVRLPGPDLAPVRAAAHPRWGQGVRMRRRARAHSTRSSRIR